MFKSRNRKSATRRIRKREESSDEDSISLPQPTTTHNNGHIKTNIQSISVNTNIAKEEEETSTNNVPTVPKFISHHHNIHNTKPSMFQSNKPKFTKKVDLKADYSIPVPKEDNGVKQQKDVILNSNDIAKLSKTVDSDEDNDINRKIEKGIKARKEMQLKSKLDEGFIPLGSKSLRAALRDRYQDLSSESSDEEEHSNQIPLNQQNESKLDEDYRLNRPSSPDADNALILNDDASISSSDEEIQWEQQLVSRGLSGPTIASTINQTVSHIGPTEQYSIMSHDHVMKRLNTALSDLRINYNESIHRIKNAETIIEEIETEERTDYQQMKSTQDRYSYYQQQTDYFTRLSGYLTDKRKGIEDIYKRYSLLRQHYQYSTYVLNLLYQYDDMQFIQQLNGIKQMVHQIPSIPDISEIESQCGPFYKGAIYYDLSISQSRNQSRYLYIEGPQPIRSTEVCLPDSDIHFITADVSIYLDNVIFYTYDDDMTTKYEENKNILLNELTTIYTTTDLQFMSLDVVLSHFSTWRETYPDDYKQAYGGLGLPSFLSVILIPSIIQSFDPLELNETMSYHRLQELPWIERVKQYGEEKGACESDKTVLPKIIQKAVIPYVKDIIQYEWNPLSIHESTLVATLLTDIASYYTTIIPELQSLYAILTTRIKQIVDQTYVIEPQLWNEEKQVFHTDAQEIIDIAITRWIRILEVINCLASYMSLGSPAPLIDVVVVNVCTLLKGMATAPFLIPKCKMFAFKIDSLVPAEVTSAKQLIMTYL